MKILAIGDFHGKFPVKLKKLAKSVDLVVSVGDYPPFRFKKVFFKHCYRKGKELWEVIGKKKYREGFLGDIKKGEKILEFLNSVEAPVVMTVGNYDHHNVEDSIDLKRWKSNWEWANQDFFSKILKKFSHLKRVDYRAVRIGDLVLIGAYGGSFPGRVKSRAYRRHRIKLEKLFKKYAKENREGRVIFVSHNVPYDCRLDKIRDKNADAIAFGKHYGSKLIRRVINKFQPVLCIGGHMHENQGKEKLGKSLVINTGAAFDGKAALIDVDEKRGKIKSVKFVK